MNAPPPFSLEPARPSAWQRTTPPRWAAIGAARLGALLLALLVASAALPWQQTAPGKGKVLAYAPAERQQQVDAPIAGRVVTWAVVEGQRVAAGDELVALSDNDALFFDRLQEERRLVEGQLQAAEAKVAAGYAKVQAAEGTLIAALAGAEAKLRSTEEKLRAEREVLSAAESNLEVAETQQDRIEALATQGLRSTVDLENARLRTDMARDRRDELLARVAGAVRDIEATERELDKVRRESEGKVAASEGELAVALSDQGDYRAKLLAMDTKLARQDAQTVVAPMAGVVARVFGGQGGEQVRAGDPLVVLVPDTDSRAVSLTVDGHDVRFVSVGDPVRLQFEGWPAVQVSGWPRTSVGTWGGQVDFVDPVDNGQGGYRVMVVPDPAEPAWPEGDVLRQGLGARGWVLLTTVPLGYELWRRLNQFPPEGDPTKAKTKDADAGPVDKSKVGSALK
jgi:adhesin transport system membrane fusion protein